MPTKQLLNLKLSHKGMILVCVPLAFELIFVTSLALQLHQAEQETARQFRSKTIIAEVDSLQNIFLEQVAIATLYATTKNKSLGDQLIQKATESQQRFTRLRQECQGRTDQLALLDKVEQIYQREQSLATDLRRSVESNTRELAFIRATDLTQEGGNLAKEMNQALEKFVAFERAGQAGQSQSVANSKLLVKAILALGILLNILLALALAVFFNKVTARRLDVLMDNTKRMTQQKDLNPLLEGTDELAHLDQVFHEMADGLAQVEKLKKEFVAMISHDLRAPLSALQMYLSLLVEGTYGKMNEVGERRGQSALKSVAQLVKLINDLLDMEKLEAGRMEMTFKQTELFSVVEYSVESVRNLAEGPGIKVEFENVDFKVTADGDRLAQVLINLLSNAIKFSPPGGTVSVTAKKGPEGIIVSVRDQGQGIPPQYRQTIFERFKQVPGQKKGGTGLGLPICKSIIEQHGGTIGVDSEEGKGTTFWFKLPLEGELMLATKPPGN